MAYLGYWLNTVLYTNISRLRLAGPGWKPARWSAFTFILSEPRESSHSIISQVGHSIFKFASYFFYLYITNWNSTTTAVYLWILMCIPSFFFPFYRYFFPPYSYYYVSFEGSHTIKLCLICQPSCLMFSISYSQPYFFLQIFFCHV